MRNKSDKLRGFTLLELMVVVAIIAILALMAMPSSTNRIGRTYIQENLQLVEPFQHIITDYYRHTGRFPEDNLQAGIPRPDLITGNYLEQAEVENGAIHLTLGQKLGGQLKGKILSLRPVYIPDSRATPVSWICGYDQIPERMSAPADNRTDLEPTLLPLRCR